MPSNKNGCLWKISHNFDGRDYVVGDVHGHLGQLKIQLENLNFDPSVDRLFFLGDIVDRGPDSLAMIDLIDHSTYISVLGNHEAMLIAGFEDSTCVQMHCSNGGDWFYKLPTSEQQVIVDKVRSWPWAIEIDVGDARVGLVHADVPDGNWDTVKTFLSQIDKAWSDGASLTEPNLEVAARSLLWRRSLASRLYLEVLGLGTKKRTLSEYKRDFLNRIDCLENVDSSLVDTFNISGIDSVYMGHTYVPIPTAIGDCYFLDSYRGEASEELGIRCINP